MWKEHIFLIRFNRWQHVSGLHRLYRPLYCETLVYTHTFQVCLQCLAIIYVYSICI